MIENSTIVEHLYAKNNKHERWCIQCQLHVDENGEIDIDYYTARFYVNYLNRPIEQRCKHQRKKSVSKEELKQMVKEEFQGSAWEDALNRVLTAIIEKIPGA